MTIIGLKYLKGIRFAIIDHKIPKVVYCDIDMRYKNTGMIGGKKLKCSIVILERRIGCS